MHTIPRIEIQESGTRRLAIMKRTVLNYNPDRLDAAKTAGAKMG